MSEGPQKSSGAGGGGDAPGASTHFVFQHKVFSVPGSYFALSADTRAPTFYVPLGDVQGVLSLPQLVAGFDVQPGSPDAALLDVVEKALGFVPRISPGDSIPRELLDGTASWSVEDRHRMIAESKISVQLASWVAGAKADVRDLGEILKLGADPQTKAKVQDAITKVSVRLGLGEARRQEVLDKINRLGVELSYIEALRDRFASLKAIALKLHQLQALYGPERGLSEEIGRVLLLMRKPAGEYDGLFTQVDTRTADVLATLVRFDEDVKFIRDTRDEIHRKFLMWDEYILRWQNLVVEMSPAADTAVRDTYRFVARHFPQSTEWQLQFGGIESRK